VAFSMAWAQARAGAWDEADQARERPATLVDSCVLLDVITGDEQWADWSAGQIAVAMDAGRVVINPLIYAEASVGYERVEELDELLQASDYGREPLPYLAGFAAGKAFLRYRRGGGDKRSPMPDFYIGAHAAVAGHRLLTRDVRRYRTYFPSIDIIAPTQAEDEATG
jgi:predicted nucleic acid-binding protein